MKKGIKISLFLMILISILFLSKNIYASSFMSERAETNYSTNEGLTSGRANDIVQSKDGYIWIAQYTGLTRYNARMFEDIEETVEGYNLNGCQALATIDNEIYIGTQKGMFRYKNGVYNKIDILNSEFSVNDIEIAADSVFFATSIGTYVYSRKNGSCSRINYYGSSSVESIEEGFFNLLIKEPIPLPIAWNGRVAILNKSPPTKPKVAPFLSRNDSVSPSL